MVRWLVAAAVAGSVGVGEARAQDAGAQDAAALPAPASLLAWRPGGRLEPRIAYVYDPAASGADRPANGFVVGDDRGAPLTHEQFARRIGDPRADDIARHTRGYRSLTVVSTVLLGASLASTTSGLVLEGSSVIPAAGAGLGLALGALGTSTAALGHHGKLKRARYTVEEANAALAPPPLADQ